MTQIDVSVTDYALTVECAWFACWVARLRTATSSFRSAFTAFFFSIAIAAAASGTVHGFFLDKSTVGYRVLWPFTLIVMGITALSGAHIVAALQFSRLIAVYFDRVALAIFVAYIVIVLFIRRDFLIPFLTIHSRNRCDRFRWRYISVQMICCSGILAAPPAASHHAFWRSEHGTQWSSVCAAPRWSWGESFPSELAWAYLTTRHKWPSRRKAHGRQIAALGDRTKELPFIDVRGKYLFFNSNLNPRRHRYGATPVALSNQVRNHPTALALLNLVDLEAQNLGATQTVADEESEYGAIAFPPSVT